MREFTEAQTLLSAQTATGAGVYLDVSDYRQIVVQIATAGNGNLTVKLVGSISDTTPDCDVAASATNPWIYLNSVDYSDNSVVAGATGYAFTGTDGVKMCEVNTNGLKWLAAIVTARSAGNVTAIAKCFNE